MIAPRWSKCVAEARLIFNLVGCAVGWLGAPVGAAVAAVGGEGAVGGYKGAGMSGK